MSGVVGFLFPDVTLANKNFSYSRQKLMRESRDNAKRLQRIRKIRQKLLSENKFSKYLLYAIGEIVLVVIGILIALWINNKNIQNQNKEKER